MLIRLIFIIFLFSCSSFAASNFEEDEFETFESSISPLEEIYDPLEKANRKIFAFNEVADKYAIEPAARGYRKAIPKPVRESIHNFLNNLSLPFSALNSFAQGKVSNGLATFSNFLINSTVGIGGLFDVARKKGVYFKPEDFGQTFAHYGAGPGPYLMLPLLGPSNFRDASGLTVNTIISPIGFNIFQLGDQKSIMHDEYLFTIVGLTAIDSREGLIEVVEDIRNDSFDPYSTIRSAYLQKRTNEIKN